MSELAERLVALLSDGRWRRIESANGSDLCSLLQADRRAVEAAIQQARLAGHPLVGSSFRGIRLSDNPDEILAYVDDREDRLRSIYAGTKALRETAQRMQAPRSTLFDDADLVA